MSDPRWGTLLEYLSRARSKDTFDSEQREYRLAIAAVLRDIVQDGVNGEPWAEPAALALRQIYGGRRSDLTEVPHNRWLRHLNSEEALGRALASFMDTGATPVDRFAAYVEAAAQERPTILAPAAELESPDLNRDAVLSLGALLNFAFAPHDLPALKLNTWNTLEQALGLEWTFRRSPVEQYALHLEFARDAEARMRAAGIDVRDMLDAQSLIQIGGQEIDFWASRGCGRQSYLAVCAIYRDEADYLAEWVEFHRLAGVERFFLYNNFSQDNHREVLAPYVEQGIVEIRDWPVLDGRVGQIAAYNDCLRFHRHDARWIAFIDLDEFFFSPSGEPLPDVLADYERWPGVAIRWVMFGTSGHETKPPGLVIDNYRRRINYVGDINMKTVADPTRVTECATAHNFDYPYLSAVDENHFPMRGTWVPSESAERLRINHYHWKSAEEYVAKCARMRAIGRPREVPGAEHFEWLRKAEEAGFDDDAIQGYAPALRQALGLSAPETARRTS